MNIPENIVALITDLQERKVNGSVTLHLDAGDVRKAEVHSVVKAEKVDSPPTSGVTLN